MKSFTYIFSYMLVQVLLFSQVDAKLKNQLASQIAPKSSDARLIKNDQIAVWIKNDGTFAREPITHNAGFYYPQNEGKTLIYCAGLWFAGKVNGDIRTACSDFNCEYQPGIILPDGRADDPEKEIYRIYLIKPGDSADSLSANYNRDYAEWPISLGAPVGNDGNPLILGDQTFWFVMNDADTTNHQLAYHTDPLNLEARVLGWLFNGSDTVLNRTLFLHYTLINKSHENIDDAFIGIWSDPDLGDANDDRSGCDTTLNLSYTYNGRDNDWRYGNHIPAVGFCMLQGPVVPSSGDTAFQFLKPPLENFKSINMSANFVFIGGHLIYFDPPYNEDGGQEVYYRMKGLARYGQLLVDPSTGDDSPFFDYGDPIKRTGWLDDQVLPYCDRRSMFSYGPFFMASGDTQRVAFAVIIGHEDHRLKSVVDLKHNTNFIRDVFKSEFQTNVTAETVVEFVSPENVELKITAEIFSENNISTVRGELYNYRNEQVESVELFDDGVHNDSSAEDYVFGNSVLKESNEDALFLNILITDENSKQHLFQKAVEKITLMSNPLTVSNVKIEADHLNMNGKVNPGENVRFTFNINNESNYDVGNVNLFLSTNDPYINSPVKNFEFYDLKALGVDSLNYDHENASTYFEINIPADIPDSHRICFNGSIFDSHDRFWKIRNLLNLNVVPFGFEPEEIIPEHIAGMGDAEFRIRIFNPPLLKKHTYTISVCDSINLNGDIGFNLVDENEGDTLLHAHEKPDQFAYNIPVTDGFKVVRAYLPDGGFQGCCYEIPGGHNCAFNGVADDSILSQSLIETKISHLDTFPYHIELEFTNNIDTAGVEGFPNGQNLFRIEYRMDIPTTGFFQAPLNIWKLENGQRAGLLNGVFKENEFMGQFNETWNPHENLWVLKSDYDPSGQLYQGQVVQNSDVLFKVYLSFSTQSSVIDAGDGIYFNYEYPATSEDLFAFVPTVIEETRPALPSSCELCQNYPNPFNPETMIKFSINQFGSVTLKIYNLMGQEIITILDKTLNPGEYSVLWNGRDAQNQQVCSGLYFVRLKNGEREHVIKMLLIR